MAYAVTYLFGAGGTAYFLVAFGFRMLDRDMASRCKEYEAETGRQDPPPTPSTPTRTGPSAPIAWPGYRKA